MEQERAARTTEHARREEEQRARADLERWEAEAAVAEAGIAQRAGARAAIERAAALWQGRCARLVVDGRHELDEITAAMARLESGWAERAAELAGLRDQLAELQNDEAFQAYCAGAERRWKEMSERDRALEVEERTTVRGIEDATRQRTARLEDARAADGRDAAQAGAEEADANARLEDALQAQGARQHELGEAQAGLDDATDGDDLAAAQLQCLRAGGVAAAPLLDSVAVSAAQREPWEARLYPYRDAVVVAEADAARARELLAALPGSTLITADAPSVTPAPAASSGTAVTPGPADSASALPGSAGGRFPLDGFLACLAQRAGRAGAPAVDEDARVWVTGGFAEPADGARGPHRQGPWPGRRGRPAARRRRGGGRSRPPAAHRGPGAGGRREGRPAGRTALGGDRRPAGDAG